MAMGANQLFQSPQWGDNSKVACQPTQAELNMCFSPRNGEIILKELKEHLAWVEESFSPRNGEIILKF